MSDDKADDSIDDDDMISYMSSGSSFDSFFGTKSSSYSESSSSYSECHSFDCCHTNFNDHDDNNSNNCLTTKQEGLDTGSIVSTVQSFFDIVGTATTTSYETTQNGDQNADDDISCTPMNTQEKSNKSRLSKLKSKAKQQAQSEYNDGV